MGFIGSRRYMGSKMTHSVLAKTLSYVGYHSPSEFGLFWNPDGTMPWKEFYWALQDDDSLRFVRDSHLKELAYLGYELPFSLDDDGILRIRTKFKTPDYGIARGIPERLFFGCRRKHFGFVAQNGLIAAGRPYLALHANRDFALRIARRRDPEPVAIEVYARKAQNAGVIFRQAGDELFLVDAVSVEFLIIPDNYVDAAAKPEGKARKFKTAESDKFPASAGSFSVQPDHFLEAGSAGKGQKTKKGRSWKTERRKDRHKRTV